jgi:Flp pilus assembly protein TadB
MTNQYFLDRMTGRDPNLRAADSDRERIAERLRKSHAEGRLDMDEFQQRLERCYAAKTLGELRELVRDLPRQEGRDERRSLGWFRWRLAPLVPILIALLVVSAATGHHVFWLWIPLVFLFWRMSWWQRRRRWAGAQRVPDDWI